MEKCIEGAKSLIQEQVKRNEECMIGQAFTTYQKFYYWTNENIKAYLDMIDFNGMDSALSVTGSGDHALNLICKGIKNIDAFDTNKLAEYFAFGLKRAMISKYSYEEFIDKMLLLTESPTSIKVITDIIEGTFPYMEEKHKKFWKEILNYNYKIQKEYGTNLNLFGMLSVATDKFNTIYNNYLVDETHYEMLKKHLSNANITFSNVNAVNLSNYFTKKYDLILLSNVLDYFSREWGLYWKYDKLLDYEQELEKITKSGGINILHYIFTFRAKYYDPISKNRVPILSSEISPSELIAGEEFWEFKYDDVDCKSLSTGSVLTRKIK